MESFSFDLDFDQIRTTKPKQEDSEGLAYDPFILSVSLWSKYTTTIPEEHNYFTK